MLISIVIPIYNTKPEFIQECLDSTNLLKNGQTLPIMK